VYVFACSRQLAALYICAPFSFRYAV